MTLNLILRGNAREQIRDAVRARPADAAGFLLGRRVNELTKVELLELADLLGIDVAGIVARANDAAVSDALAAGVGRNVAARETGDVAGDAAEGVDVGAQAVAIRRELGRAMVEGDFNAVTARITSLLHDANKPAERVTVTETVTVYVDANAAPGTPNTVRAAPVVAPTPTHTEKWSLLFGIKGAMGKRTSDVFAPGAGTPAVDPQYLWPLDVTPAALCAWGRGRNVWLYGPAGTGKSSFAEQYAARTGRPFALIPCDDTTEAPELIGMTVPFNGGTRFQDGALTAAIRVPNTVILIDEPTVARSGAVMVLQSVLASRVLAVKETGEMVRVAEGVTFVVADNTNGTGGGGAEGYEGTRRMNKATLDRFSVKLRLGYMVASDEVRSLCARTGCTPALAEMLVKCAGLTRTTRAAYAIGFRRLVAWAEALTDGIEPRSAFEFTIANDAGREGREPVEQACALGLDKKAVLAALLGVSLAAVPAASMPDATFADGN